jgi:hypothetical protein
MPWVSATIWDHLESRAVDRYYARPPLDDYLCPARETLPDDSRTHFRLNDVSFAIRVLS